MRKATVIATLVTLVFWLAGCNTLERFSLGLHEDIAAYNKGVADSRDRK